MVDSTSKFNFHLTEVGKSFNFRDPTSEKYSEIEVQLPTSGKWKVRLRKLDKTHTKKGPFQIRGRRGGDDDGHHTRSGVASIQPRRKSPP